MQCDLVAKTYDLRSAYRQVPIKQSHLKYAYFSVYNHRKGCAEMYRMLTLPFGATHSVYSFLRLARMLYSIATRGLMLMTTNFYDDFILASPRSLTSSSACGMELVFMLTGWNFAREGKKLKIKHHVGKASWPQVWLQSAQRAPVQFAVLPTSISRRPGKIKHQGHGKGRQNL